MLERHKDPMDSFRWYTRWPDRERTRFLRAIWPNTSRAFIYGG